MLGYPSLQEQSALVVPWDVGENTKKVISWLEQAMENKTLTLLQGSKPIFQSIYSPFYRGQLFFVCSSKDFPVEPYISTECWLLKESHSPKLTSIPSSLNIPWRNKSTNSRKGFMEILLQTRYLFLLHIPLEVGNPHEKKTGWPLVKDIRLV